MPVRSQQPTLARRRSGKTRARRGVALIVVIVTISISLTLFGLWARNIVRDHRRVENHYFRAQATRLAEAGLKLAIARQAANPQFQEETWAIPAESLDGTHTATVQIRLQPTDDTETLRYEAIAQFPAAAERRAQVTKRIEASISPRATGSTSETEP
jgi:Tfp pilus assembly protein PilX